MVEVVVNLSVRDLTHDDLTLCSWAGTRLHLRQVAMELERARVGVVDYLAVCPPSDVPVAIGGVDYWASRRANPRALALYERLGYVSYGRKREAWDAEGSGGVIRCHEAICTVMRKPLS